MKSDFCIASYIASTEYIIKLGSEDESESIVRLFDSLLKNNVWNKSSEINITMLYAYTTKVYPRIITYNRNNTVILWDANYWSFASLYYDTLVEIKYLGHTHMDLVEHQYTMVLTLFMNHIMATKGSSPYKLFSNKFGELYAHLSAQEKTKTIERIYSETISSTEEMKDVDLLMYFAKIFVFSHELCHIYYKTHPHKRSSDVDILLTLVRKVKAIDGVKKYAQLVKRAASPEMEALYNLAIEEIENVLCSDVDLKLREELLCDFFAYRDTFFIVSQFEIEWETEDALYYIHEAARFSTSLLTMFSLTERQWVNALEFQLLGKSQQAPNYTDQYMNHTNSFAKYSTQATLMRNEIIMECFAVDCIDQFGCSGLYNGKLLNKTTDPILNQLYSTFDPRFGSIVDKLKQVMGN